MTAIRSQIDAMVSESRRISGVWNTRVADARRGALLATLPTNGILALLLVVAGLLTRRLLRVRAAA